MHANVPASLGRRVKVPYGNVASSGGCQRGQRTPGLSVTVSLSTEMLTSLPRAGGDAQVALAATARQENWFMHRLAEGMGSAWSKGANPSGR